MTPLAPNDLTSYLIYCLSKQLPNELMVSAANFQYSLRQHDVHLKNNGPIICTFENKAGYAFGLGYIIIDK